MYILLLFFSYQFKMTSKSWSNPAMMKVESFADCFFGELVGFNNQIGLRSIFS